MALDAASAACDVAYAQKHPDVTAAKVIDFLLFDDDNPSSVKSALDGAQQWPRRAHRPDPRRLGKHQCHVERAGPDQARQASPSDRLPVFLDWIRQRSMAFRGALLGTMLRNDNYYFSQLGNFIERADNTARILDVKYFILLPRPRTSAAISICSNGRKSCARSRPTAPIAGSITTAATSRWLIAEFLILREEMPRSLVFSYHWINTALDGLGDLYGKRYACHDQAQKPISALKSTSMDQIFQSGLHEFLQDFMAANSRLSA